MIPSLRLGLLSAWRRARIAPSLAMLALAAMLWAFIRSARVKRHAQAVVDLQRAQRADAEGRALGWLNGLSEATLHAAAEYADASQRLSDAVRNEDHIERRRTDLRASALEDRAEALGI